MRSWLGRRSRFVVGVMAVSLLGLALPATAADPVIPGKDDVKSAAWTPSLATSGTDGSVERVRQLVPCGPNMYAVGRFTAVKRGGDGYARDNAFSFSATNGTVTGWNPHVNGQVNSVALSPDCAIAYLGGTFTEVNGTPAKNFAAVRTDTGQLVADYPASASGRVNTLVLTTEPGQPQQHHLLVGGTFTSINGSSRDYFVSLNPDTGRDDGYLDLNISGKYVYPSVRNNSTQVYNTTLSPDGTKLLAMGVFTSVGGSARQQIFMLDLGVSPQPGQPGASVDPWYSLEFNQNCHVVEPFYLQDASWAPDGSTIYIVTTGYKPASGPGSLNSNPRDGLCDAAAAFPSTSGLVSHTWVNFTGCDSLYSTAADANHVYIGGHQRWADNGLACDREGHGFRRRARDEWTRHRQRPAGLQPHQGAGTGRHRHARDRCRSVDRERQPGEREPVCR